VISVNRSEISAFTAISKKAVLAKAHRAFLGHNYVIPRPNSIIGNKIYLANVAVD
jgi:hypothetical protein